MKNATLKDMFSKQSVKRTDQSGDTALSTHRRTSPSATGSQDDTPVIRIFLENLFSALREDLAASKCNIATEVKGMKKDIGELDQRVHALQQTGNSQEEKLEDHRTDLLELRDKNTGLIYQLEDLEN
ncbi:hypothetical protein NDU88_006186 [Pleurodeles waltl]|uniref:Uncharacterized protein n=1 Tax=Pleurodeles waltl TaxID=8319 RepID=A0AAV7MYJ5_PLEWA|nr:hypothetical protein NDU88_006186 [Pleurodeles waltl]